MAKGMIDLTSERDLVNDLVSIKEQGPVAPVTAYGKTRGYLQDGRWLPPWLVWLRGRKRLALALVAVAGAGWAAWRMAGGAR